MAISGLSSVIQRGKKNHRHVQLFHPPRLVLCSVLPPTSCMPSMFVLG